MVPTEREVDDRSSHLLYHDDGDRFATISLTDRWSLEHHRWVFPFRITVWHDDGTTIDSF